MKKEIGILLFTIILSFPIISSAETVILKSGKTVEGKIIEKTDKYIKIDFQGVPITYFMDEIESISEAKRNLAIIKETALSQGSDNENIFQDRLYKYLSSHSNADFSPSEQGILSKNNLLNFAEEFPDSRFADDAFYIPIIYDASSKGDLEAVEQMIAKYPTGKLEDSTVKFIEKKFGKDASELCMPYDLSLLILKAENALKHKDYDGIIKYSSEFIKGVDKNNLQIKRHTLYFAYKILLISYRNLGRKVEGEEIKNTMISVFPENKDEIEKSWSKVVSK